jgi:hypothetical protein
MTPLLSFTNVSDGGFFPDRRAGFRAFYGRDAADLVDR